MDSLTQIVLGASVAAVVVPAAHRRRALLAGAVLGTVPDLDVFALLWVKDPITRMTWHRSFSHSLLVLLPLAVASWAVVRRLSTTVREASRAWLCAMLLALGTHPLLDAHTVYGTQLLWPLPLAPTMWSTLFIIDPLYTAPLLLGVGVAAWAAALPRARTALLLGLLVSSAYLGWSWVAKRMVERQLVVALAERGLQEAPRFSVPAPFTTWVWRVVALTPDGHVEGRTHPWSRRLALHTYEGDPDALRWALTEHPSAGRLRWFAHGFVQARTREDALVLTDLRMGAEPDYFFRFEVARREPGAWSAIPPRQLEAPEVSADAVRALWAVEPHDVR